MDYDPNAIQDPDEGIKLDPVLQRQSYERQKLQEEEDKQRQIEDQQLQQQEAEAAAQQQQADQQANEPNGFQLGNIGQNIQNAFEAPTAVVGGLIDFTDDVLELGGQIVGQDWEAIPEDWGPQNKTPWGKALRAVVSFVGPTIGLGSLTKAGIMQVAKLAKVANTSKAVSMIGRMGVDMAAGTAVDAINSHSTGDNLLRTLKDNVPSAVGWLPDDWATLDTDSPDIKRNKNIMEGAGLGLLSSALEGGIAFARSLKGLPPGVTFKGKDEASKAAFQKITNKSPQTRSAHPLIDRILKDENYRAQHVDEMALVDLDQVGGIDYVDRYMPNLHSEVSDAYETIPYSVRPDAVPQMMVDAARIQDNVGTYYGRMSKFHTDASLRSLNLDDIVGRRLVKDLDKRTFELGNFEAHLPDGRMMGSKSLLKAGDELALKILDPRLDKEALKTVFDNYRDLTQVALNTPALKTLNSEASAAAKTALTELQALYREVLSGDLARASAYLQTSLAGEVADAATGARVMGDAVDTTYMYERILDKMELLWYETDMSSSVTGWKLNNEKIWQEAVKNRNSNPGELKRFASESLGKFRLNNKTKAQQNRTFWASLKTLNSENPKYLDPLIRAYELSDGDVNSLYKLNNYMKNVLGVANKAFLDGQPEIPSQVVQGMWATFYNAKLSSLLTPVKALTNNFALLLMKPMNVALGAALHGDWRTLQRSWMQYSTHMDTTMRASGDYMSQMFKRIAADPTVTQRADFITQNNEMIQLGREFAEAEAAQGRYGAAFKMQWVNTMQKINNHPWVRYSMNFMESGDAFVKSAIGMSEARGRAYDEILQLTGKAPTADALQEAADKIYKEMFDENGLITDQAVTYASREISMNLDNEFAQGLDDLLKKAPILKTVVLFPRTSVNVLDFVHKHSPLSYFIGEVQKVKELSNGLSQASKAGQELDWTAIQSFLATKGIDPNTQGGLEQAWKTFRAESEGRVAMGTMMVTMGGWMFAQGNLTGNGHYDKQVNKFQQNAGEKPLRSWKGIDGKWRSYDGVEPIATFLALTADILQNTQSLGTTKSEQMLQKLGYAVSMNLTNKSFLQGLQPITELMNGQPAALSRWAANTASAGLLTQMSRIMMPGLREVVTVFFSMLRNKYNILDAAGIGEALPKAYDFIDGSVVGANDPLTNFLNNTLPFKTNSDPSPVKQFLIDTEFDVQPSLKSSLKGAKYTAEQRSRLSQIMGQSGHFRTGLELLMKDKRVEEDLTNIRKLREAGITSDQAELSDSYTHIRIKRLLTASVNHAKRQLAEEMPDIRESELNAARTRRAQKSRDYSAITLQNK